MKLKVGDVLSKAHSFVILEPYGPYGDLGSFKPIKVEFNEKTWTIICSFKVKNQEVKAKILVDDDSGEIIGYEELR